jgi:hypothetical protein
MKISDVVKRIFNKPNPSQILPVARMPNKENHSALICSPLLEIYGSLFCMDNQRIIFKDEDRNLKVLMPQKTLPRSKGKDFEAYNLDDGFAIRYKENDYFFQAEFEVIEVYNMRIFNIKQEAIEAVFHNGELMHAEDVKEGK